MHVAQRFEHTKIQVTSVYERPHQVVVQGIEDFLPGRRACNTRLHPRVALPVPAVLQQVGLERGETDDGWSAVAEGPEARVDAKDEAVFGHVVEQFDHLARQPAEVLLRTDRAHAVAFAVRRVQEDQVDV